MRTLFVLTLAAGGCAPVAFTTPCSDTIRGLEVGSGTTPEISWNGLNVEYVGVFNGDTPVWLFFAQEETEGVLRTLETLNAFASPPTYGEIPAVSADNVLTSEQVPAAALEVGTTYRFELGHGCTNGDDGEIRQQVSDEFESTG